MTAPESRVGPVRAGDPVELRLAGSAIRLVAALSVPTIAVCALVAGRGGALGAAIATAVVVGMFAMTGAMMSWAARISPTAMLAAALGGYLLRLMIYAALILLLRPVEAIHDVSLAVSAAVLLVAALAWEMRLVSRSPQLFWVDAAAAKPAAGPALYESSPASNVERTRP